METENLWEVLRDMRAHVKIHGNHIVRADNPLQLQFGWQCKITGNTWLSRISTIKQSLNNRDLALKLVLGNEKDELFNFYIEHTEDEFNRYMKLKAFH